MTRCKQNIFIFDEVDKMPPGVLDIVKPFMDYYEVGAVLINKLHSNNYM